MDRLSTLDRLVDLYLMLLEEEREPEVRAYIEQQLQVIRVEQAGERGAKGLNPTTGKA